ncbi:WD40 repeat domain-containing protein [Nonomuraea sp. NN258]|uniref:AAA family ATPase n=1 Tax=Nonomuraea antri TaxID=2730852 RepID=UPI0015690D8E|nr:AAA family ATPase [Nonomuraea antri]NRQ33376.1 WD40 repeat domain-containing protein [Nonomuraea antri]
MDSERGHRFRGRTAALTAITAWLDRATPDQRVLVVTGSPGVGKSAVLGRIVTTADPAIRATLGPDDQAVRAASGSVACAVHAKGKTALDVATEIARAASAALPATVADFAPVMRAALSERAERARWAARRATPAAAEGREEPQGGRFNLILDALDEATSPAQARIIVSRIVLPLVTTCADLGAQVVLATRRRDDDGDLLGSFGQAAHPIDLDDPRFFALEDLTAYALATLQLIGDERAGNPYADHRVARPVAAAIARRSGHSFLIAGLVARTHGLHDHDPIDPAILTFPDSVEHALAGYIDRLPGVGSLPAAEALTALAFAEAPGLDLDLWTRAIQALNPAADLTAEQLGRFAGSSAANFLVESSTDHHRQAFRLFHQALNDVLLDVRARRTPRHHDEQALTRAFLTTTRQRPWASAPPYLLRSLAGHAVRAGLLENLLSDERFLLHADLPRLSAHAAGATSPEIRQYLRLIQLTPQAAAATPPERAALFNVTSVLAQLPPPLRIQDRAMPYRAAWARVQPRTDQALLLGHTGVVTGVCAFTLNDRTLLASGGYDGSVRIWDPATGQAVGDPLIAHTSGVYSVCAFTLNGRTLLASSGGDASVWIWDPATRQAVGDPLTGHTDWVRDVCAFTLNDRALLASGGYDGSVRIWDPATGQAVGDPLIGHADGVYSVCAFTLNGRTLLASSGDDASVRIWDPATGQALGDPLIGHTGRVHTVCAFVLNGRTLLASSGDDASVRIWDPATRQAVGDPLTGHTDWVRDVCAFTLNGRTLLASGGGDASVRIWDSDTGQALGNPLTRHTGGVHSMCAFTLNGRTLLVSGSSDASVRIWDPATGQAVGDPLIGHTGGVYSMCAFTLSGRTLLASGGDDERVRIWDPATGQALGDALIGHTDRVNSVRAFTLNGRTLLASGGSDASVRIWDPDTGEHQRIPGRAVTLRAKIAAIFSRGGRRHDGHTGWVNSVCAFTLNERALLVSGSSDASVRIWDPATGQVVGDALIGHTGWVTSVCAFTLNGRTLLASGGGDERVRIWDPATGQAVGDALTGHTGWVNSVCAFTLDGRTLLASGGEDASVRIWDPATRTCEMTIPVHAPALACCWTSDVLVIGMNTGILALRLNPAARGSR